MRYAIYGLLVLCGIGGVLFGGSSLQDPRTEARGLLTLLIGVVALGALGVVMAVEHMQSVLRAELLELRRLAGQAEKRAQAEDAAKR